MSYSAKPRPAVDLDEIARQLNEPRPAAAQPSPQGRGDSLSELARIVGQDDPYKGILGPTPAAAPRGPRADIQFPPGPAADEGPAQAHEHAYADEPYEETYPSEEQEDLLPLEPRRSRKGLIAVAGVLGVAVLGVGGALVFGGGKGFVPAGDPPVIAAADGPVKVQPQAPGGVEIPNQNKQIYERAAADTQTRVVNREEQPVDVRQAVRAVATNPEPVAAPQGPGPVQNALAATLGEPRRVRTVAIRPDGTVVSDAVPTGGSSAAPSAPASPAQPQPSPAAPQRNGTAMPTLTLPPAAAAPAPRPAAATPAAAAPAPTGTPAPAPTPAPVAVAPTPAAATPAPATPASATPVAAAPPAAPRPAAATPSAPPAATPTPPSTTPAPARVAAASPAGPMSIAPGATATPPAPAAPAGGGWAVQLGVRPSEGEARAAFAQFQQKHGELKGQPAIIRQAEVNGSTIYRVRVGPLSKDDASALCSKLQGSGGQCFVAKN